MSETCRYCCQPVPAAAKICANCGHSQSKLAQLGVALKWMGGATTVISLVLAVISLWGLYRERLHNLDTVAEMVAAAKLLQHDRDYRRAWDLYEQARLLDPGSPKVRRGQEQLVLAWLPNIRVSGGETFSAIIDITLPIVVRARVRSDSARQAANFQALMGWSHYLIQRERPAHEADIEDLYRQALLLDADNVLSNTLLGHWLMTHEQLLEEGLRHFSRAASASADIEELGFVRDYQWLSLRRLRSETKPGSDEHINACKAQLTLALELASSPRYKAVERHPDLAREILSAYSNFHYGREDWFDQVWPVLTPAQHRQLLDGMRPQSINTDSLYIHQRFVLARLEEKLGNTRLALDIYRQLDAEISDHYLARSYLDDALRRLGSADHN